MAESYGFDVLRYPAFTQLFLTMSEPSVRSCISFSSLHGNREALCYSGILHYLRLIRRRGSRFLWQDNHWLFGVSSNRSYDGRGRIKGDMGWLKRRHNKGGCVNYRMQMCSKCGRRGGRGIQNPKKFYERHLCRPPCPVTSSAYGTSLYDRFNRFNIIFKSIMYYSVCTLEAGKAWWFEL